MSQTGVPWNADASVRSFTFFRFLFIPSLLYEEVSSSGDLVYVVG
jgi:hypothetical protein